MTVKSLEHAIELHDECRETDERAVAYVYQRSTGEVLFAVFTGPEYVDLDRAPEVVFYRELVMP